MLKSLSIEQKFFDRCFLSKSPHYGIVVGGLNKDEECVFFLLSSVNQESTSSIKNIEDISLDALKLQCEKISRMLPAGIHLSGLYFSDISVASPQCSTRIKKLLFMIRDLENKHHHSLLVQPVDAEKLFMHIDTAASKISAKSVGFTQDRDFFRPIDVKIRPVIERWRAIKTHVTLSVETLLPSERNPEHIMGHLKAAVDPYLQAIGSESRLLVNNEIRNREDSLFSVKAKDLHKNVTAAQGKNRHQKRHTLPKETGKPRDEKKPATDLWEGIEFTLFGPDFPCWQRTSSTSSIDSGSSSDVLASTSSANGSSESKNNLLLLHGRIPGIAYLPIEHTSVDDALRAFRTDLIQSILVRLELLSNELNITSGEIEAPIMQLPQRVLIRIPVCPYIPLSDYKFISETPEDVIRRVGMFCRPLGSPVMKDLPGGDQDDATAHDLSPRAESGESATSDAEFICTTSEDFEPVLNTSCLDTHLERACEGGSPEDEMSDVEIIEEIAEIAQTVSRSKNMIFSAGGAFLLVVVAVLVAIYLDWSPF